MEATQNTASTTTLFPEPSDKDFDEDIGEEERKFYAAKYKEKDTLNDVKFHCTACDKHLGTAPKSESRMRVHPMLKTLVCRPCHTFYNSGEFERGDDGSELYCRWCGQGGQVYCCSGCPTVFCAKCIKRNLGASKIREIESMDDWKCFRCSPEVLWDLRADCWALLRYCDYKNRLVHITTDPELKEQYSKECSVDDSECCRSRRRTTTPVRKKEVKEEKIKEDRIKEDKVKDDEDEKTKALAKIPSGIKVKKFASISQEPILKTTLEKKAVKRPASPIKFKQIRAPIPIAPFPRPIISSVMGSPVRPVINPPPPKKPRYQNPHVFHTYTPRYPKARMQSPRQTNYNSASFNGYNPYSVNTDNINLSLESLTQGLDMAAVTNLAAANSMAKDFDMGNDELVCTPDFPLEPLCEVTEDNADDDVECITPGPVAPPKPSLQPQRTLRTLPDISPDNIIQMTENDVTVNSVTGGLKFRVDPQTLCSNKMYRLPDGRIFAINSNPNMPGGYSATIVAVSETTPNSASVPPRGTTFRANVSTVTTPSPRSTRQTTKRLEKQKPDKSQSDKSQPDKSQPDKSQPVKENSEQNTRRIKNRTPDMNTSIEWYRYHIIDSIDALQYSLGRLERLKTQADTQFLRTRTVEEMKALHSQLERHLRTSYSRFHEIRENLYKGYKNYLREKGKKQVDVDEDDDDDVEILNDSTKDDPIFIDENSMDTSDNEANTLSSENNSAELDSSKNVDPLAVIETQDNEKESEEKESANNEPEVDSICESVDEINQSTNIDIARDSNSKEIENDHTESAKIKDDINIKIPSTEKTEEDTFKNEKSEHDNVEAISENKEDVKDKDIENDTEEKDRVNDDEEKENDNDNEEKENDNDNEEKENDNDNEEKENDSVDEEKEKESDNEETEIEQNNVEINNEKDSEEKNMEKVDEKKEDKEISKVKETDDEVKSQEIIKNNNESIDKVSSSEDEILSSIDISEKVIEAKTNNTSDVRVKSKESSPNTTAREEEPEKVNGNDESMEVDTNGEDNKDNDNEIQMSDEMIDNLLADDGPHEELSEELQKLTERSLDSLGDNDLINSGFN